MRFVMTVVFFVVGCSEDPRPQIEAPEPGERAPRCSDGTWGVAAYDALMDVEGVAPLTRPEVASWVEQAAGEILLQRLQRAAETDPDELPTEARHALQNDVWGLWQRVHRNPVESERTHALENAAARLIRRLAPEEVEVFDGVPAPVASVLGEGWRERESELPSLQHERLFGLRRVFHVVRRGESERALYSTMVVLDGEGHAQLTGVPGELEMLRFEGETLVQARVFELHRRGLRCGLPNRGLREIDEVSHVPGAGANGFIVAFEPPVALAALPCAQCHDDASLMSLPSNQFPLGQRYEALLAPLREDAHALGW